jgi:hypothetical protein
VSRPLPSTELFPFPGNQPNTGSNANDLPFSFTDKLNFTNGSEDGLTTYSFGAKAYGHCFCPDCGSGLFLKKMDGTGYTANLRSVEGIDLAKIDRDHFDGARLL